MADPVPVSPTPQIVQPTVTWNGIAQTALMAIVAAIGSLGTYQLSNRPSAPNISPAPPAPVITAATLHEDILRLERKLDENSEKPSQEIADLYSEFRAELVRIEKRIDEVKSPKK